MLAERFIPRLFEQIAFVAAVHPKGFCDDLAFIRTGFPVAAQVVEVILVENHRASAQQMLALEFVVDERRRVLVGQRLGKVLLHHAQCLDRTAVVVLPMGADHAFRKTS